MADENEWKAMFYSLWEARGNTFVQFLLDTGLDVNALNKFGKTMLSYAAEWGNLEITEFLVEKGADGNVGNSDGSVPLHIATQYCRKNIVKFFLDIGISSDIRDNNQSTPLHYVSYNEMSSVGSQEIVHLLLNSYADIDAVNRIGRTPLQNAAYYERKHIVKLFIKLGANVNCGDEARWTVLHHSCRHGWSGIVQTLVEGDFDIDLNLRTSEDRTPLLLAATWSHRDTVELLIKSGANLDYNYERKWSVLHNACRAGWLDLVKYLANAGCDLNAKDERKRTPIFLAAEYKHCSIVEYLIDSGANPSGKYGIYGRSVLHIACERGWLNVINSMIKMGSDINVQDTRNHDTPLHVAVHVRKTGVLRSLLEAGADWHIQNSFGITAFNKCLIDRISTRAFYLEAIILFIENGAYFQSNDCNEAIRWLQFKKDVLQDVKLCAQLLINQFNDAVLPKIYEIPAVAERLPYMEKLKITSKGNVAKEIAMSVNYEIETKGYCDILNVRPIVLSCLCIKSVLVYYDN